MNAAKNHATENATFSIPLSQAAHGIAQQFAQQQANNIKAKQVYLNTLAAYAIGSYLQVFDIEVDLDSSDSWEPTFQALMDTAALHIKGLGQLECRPVLPNVDTCYIPADIWENRIGYVAVQLNQALTEAHVLGFMESVAQEQVSIEAFDAADQLLLHVTSQIQKKSIVSTHHGSVPHVPLVNLGQWLDNVIESGWLSLEDLFARRQPALSFRSRKTPILEAVLPKDDGAVSRGIFLDELKLPTENDSLALILRVKRTEDMEKRIWVNVIPVGDHAMLLPDDLEVVVLDQHDEAVMQAQARKSEKVQFTFRGEQNDTFKVRCILGDQILTKHFQI